MGKRCRLAEQIVKGYSNSLEGKFKVKIGDIGVAPYMESYKDAIVYCNNGLSKPKWWEKVGLYLTLKVEEDLISMMVWQRVSKKIYVNDSVLAQIFSSKTKDKTNIMHELAHTVQHSIESKLYRHINDEKVDEYFSEGFATFVMYDFPEIYKGDKKVLSLIKRQRRDVNAKGLVGLLEDLITIGQIRPYRVGYQFWKQVTDKIGKDKIVEIFKKPPRTMNEIKNPKVYLERAFNMS